MSGVYVAAIRADAEWLAAEFRRRIAAGEQRWYRRPFWTVGS